MAAVDGSLMYQTFNMKKDYTSELQEGDIIVICGTVGLKEDLILAEVADVDQCFVFAKGETAADLCEKNQSDSRLDEYFENAKNQAELKEQQNTGNDISYSEKICIFNIFYFYDSWRYEAIVEIENTGDTAVYLDGKSFDLESKDGHLIQTDSYVSTAPDVIRPGEKGYFHNQGGTTINDQSVDMNNLTFVPHYTIRKANKLPHDFRASDLSFTNGIYGATVTGRVYNDTNEEQSIYIDVIFYDENDDCIGISGTNVYGMMPNEYTSFEISGLFTREDSDISRVRKYFLYPRETVYQ